MGIQGLLPLLKDIETEANLSDFSGQTVGVDVSCWLHKGAFACAMDLAMGKKTEVYINFVMKRIELMLALKVIPFVVFDGAPLPAKQGTNDERRKRREENIAKGKEYLKCGEMSKALDYFRRATTITSAMTTAVASCLRSRRVRFIFAPYEADAQLAYLCKTKVVSAVITEDSDLFVFGCPRLLYKMDKNGYGKEIQFKNLGSVEGFEGYSVEDLQVVCTLSGCDYLPSINGIGLKKAQKYFKSFQTPDMIFSRSDLRMRVDEKYKEGFTEALLTFKHQRVYDLDSSCLVPLSPFPDGTDEQCMDFLGPDLPPSVAQAIAFGEIDASSREEKLGSVTERKRSSFKKTADGHLLPRRKFVKPSLKEENMMYFKANKAAMEIGSYYHVKNSENSLKPFRQPSLLPPEKELIKTNTELKKNVEDVTRTSARKTLGKGFFLSNRKHSLHFCMSSQSTKLYKKSILDKENNWNNSSCTEPESSLSSGSEIQLKVCMISLSPLVLETSPLCGTVLT